MKIEVFRGKDGQWYFRVKAGNGQIVAQSEGYTRKYDAKKGAIRLVNGTGLLCYRNPKNWLIDVE